MKKIDLIGRVFYRLTVIGFAGVNARRQSLWTCQCLCSKEVVVLSYSLRGGMTKSCGCLNKEKVLTNSLMHGHAKQTKNTPEYRAWQHAKSRCFNPNVDNFQNYGGRGISMCERWLNSFENFLSDMGEKPEPKHKYSIDREDNDGGYEPSNCKWKTLSEQAKNRRKKRKPR